MAALTLRIPPLQARNTSDVAPQSVSTTTTTMAGEGNTAPPPINPTLLLRLPARAKPVDDSEVVKRCYKCSMPLPSYKWPWKRCLECRLEAERVAQESTARSVKRVIAPDMRRKKVSRRATHCAVCFQRLAYPVDAGTLCSECNRLGLTAPSSSSAPSPYYRPPKRLKPLSPIDQRPSHFSSTHPLPPPEQTFMPPQPQTEWPLDRLIDKLSTAKHYNDRGEFLFPQFLPPAFIEEILNSTPPFRPLRPSSPPPLPPPPRSVNSHPGWPAPTSTSNPHWPLNPVDSKPPLPAPPTINAPLPFTVNTANVVHNTSTHITPQKNGYGQVDRFSNTALKSRSSLTPTSESIIDLTAPPPPPPPPPPPTPHQCQSNSQPKITTIDPTKLLLGPGPRQGEFTFTLPTPPTSPASLEDGKGMGMRGEVVCGDETEDDDEDGEDGERENVRGWDSELTELTESDEDSEDEDSEDEDEGVLESPKPSLFIRIPPPQRQSSPHLASTSSPHLTSTSKPLPLPKLKIKLKLKRTRKPAHVCQRRMCQNLLTRSARWKMCLGCRVVECERVRGKLKGRGGSRGVDGVGVGVGVGVEEVGEVGIRGVQSAPSTTTSTSTTTTPHTRKCAIKSCTHALPPLPVYRWKLCSGCRARTRRRARERKYGAPLRSDCEDDDSPTHNDDDGGEYGEGEEGDEDEEEDGEEDEEDEEVPLAKKLAMKRRIQSLKGVKLMFRGRTVASVDTRAPGSGNVTPGTSAGGGDGVLAGVLAGVSMSTSASRSVGGSGSGVKVRPLISVRSMLKEDKTHRAPLYQSFDALLSDLHHLLTTYLQTHDMYVVMQLSSSFSSSNTTDDDDVMKTEKENANDRVARKNVNGDVNMRSVPMKEKKEKTKTLPPAVFTFNGEYSVVVDPSGGDVGARIEQLRGVIGEVLGVELTHVGFNVDPSGGTVTATYSCLHEAVVHIPLGLFTPAPATTPTHPLPHTNGVNSLPPFLPSALPLPPPPPAALLRKLSGELTISISWDRSHVHFPGMRTVIGFCLVG